MQRGTLVGLAAVIATLGCAARTVEKPQFVWTGYYTKVERDYHIGVTENEAKNGIRKEDVEAALDAVLRGEEYPLDVLQKIDEDGNQVITFFEIVRYISPTNWEKILEVRYSKK